MSSLSGFNNVHVGFLSGIPLLWLSDGADLRDLFSGECRTAKEGKVNHLLLGNDDVAQGVMLIDMDACVLQLFKEFQANYEDDDLTDWSGGYQEVLSAIQSIGKTIDEEENEEIVKALSWKLDLNFLHIKNINKLYTSFDSIVEADKKENQFYVMDFNEDFKLALGMFIVWEMPTDHCLIIPEMRYFASLLKKLSWGEMFTDKMEKSMDLFTGVLRSNKLGKFNNKLGQTTWGYDLQDWIADNAKRKPLGTNKGM